MLEIKKALDLEVILDRRYKTNTLNTTGREDLARCILSKDNTKDLMRYWLNMMGVIEIWPIINDYKVFRV